MKLNKMYACPCKPCCQDDHIYIVLIPQVPPSKCV